MRLPSLHFLFLAACSVALMSPSRSDAADGYATGFEAPTFANGSQLLGQDGWSTAIPPFLNAPAAKVTNEQALSGTQSLRVKGSDLMDTSSFTDPSTGSAFPAETTAPYAAVGSYRYPLPIDTSASSNKIIQLRTDVRVDGSVTPDARRFAGSLAARSANDGGYAEIELASNGTVTLFTSQSGNPVQTSPLSLNTWHQLGIDVDYGKDLFTFFVDGSAVGSYPFDPANTSNAFARGALVAYAMPDDTGLSFQRANYQALFDNFSIRAVPEPALSSLLLGGWMLVVTRRLRRR